jgi:hypothetical protein
MRLIARVSLGLIGLLALMAAVRTGPGAGARSPTDAIASSINIALHSGLISPARAQAYTAIETAASRTLARLRGVRRRELGAELRIVGRLAARGALTPGRMPLVFLTLDRNVLWWSEHGPPAPGSPGEPEARGRHCKRPRAASARLAFPGSGILFEYYPGRGLQLQVNGTFGAANALLQRGTPDAVAAAARTLDQMRPLAATRDGALTWEYEFPYGRAQPPWTSALAQGTAIEAYTRAAARLQRPDYLDLARQLVRVFERSPPAGLRLRLGGANWYLLYSFPPHALVLNAQLDALIALYDLARATADPAIGALEREGLRAARDRIRRFDTGRWSRYAQGGGEASLNYHVLNLDLARALCQRTGEPAICSAWRRFARELDRRCPLAPGRHRPGRGPTPGAGTTGPTGPVGTTGTSGPGGPTGPGQPGPTPPAPPAPVSPLPPIP